MNYHWLREMADSWGLVVMGLVFLTLIAWTFRPGARPHLHTAAHMIFDEEPDNG